MDTTRANDEVLVRVEGVSKKFCRSLKKSLWYGLCDIASELNPRRSNELPAGGCKLEVANAQSATRNSSEAGLLQPATANPQLSPPLRPGEFWAVNDVSFELRRGECLGLIGHNGAGKTTLLKMLNGLIKPDAGTITMRGRVGALIALGAGFNPILTGRENIYINASVLGLSKKEIDGKINEIIDFAEIGEFIDMPVQNYSSGMQVRLGFSIASSLSPDVLILDEVLAVGDIGFVIKCLNRVRQLTANAAVIFVSHQMQFVSQFCSRVILMEHGGVALEADEPQIAVNRYFTLAKATAQPSGTGGVEIHDVRLSGGGVSRSGDDLLVDQGTEAVLDLDFSVTQDAEAACLHVTIADQSESAVMIYLLVGEDGDKSPYRKGRHRLALDLGRIELNSGRYSLQVGAEGMETGRILCLGRTMSPFTVRATHNHWAKMVRPVVPR